MRKEIIIIFPTSGAGLGHLTRAIAIAKRLRALSTKYEILFVTSSKALELIRQEGFLFYYIPSREGTSKSITDIEWTQIVQDFFRQIIKYYKPKAVIYDAAFPYWMIYEVLHEEMVPKTIWIKRECYKDGLEFLNEFEAEFGLIIMPKELPTQKASNTDRKKYVNPIVTLSEEEYYDRTYVRERFEIKSEELAVYIQLGAGIANDVSDITKEVVTEVLKQERTHLLLGSYQIGSSVSIDNDQWDVIEEYPACRVPALLIPSENPIVDCQFKRAKLMEEKRYGICINEMEQLDKGVERLFHERETIQRALAYYDGTNGVCKAAEYIMNYIESSGG